MDVRRQDMPPEGGYKPINFKRIPAKSFFNGLAILGGYLGMTAAGSYIFFLTNKSIVRDETEIKSVKFAITPMLQAERDREYLKQLRRNRDSEADLMKNVEGWKVGTWYGDPIYRGKQPTSLFEPQVEEYYVHTDHNEYKKRAHLSLLS